MKYYQELAKSYTFSLFDVCNLVGNRNSASSALQEMLKNGSVRRIRQNLYTCIDFSSNSEYASRFHIASNVSRNSFISGHTAFEFYGFYNQVYYDVQVFSTSRFKEFDYDGFSYKNFLAKGDIQVDTIQGVRVASIERTIVDSIQHLGKVMDAEELVKCIDLVHTIDEKKILEMLEFYDVELLYRKVGYVLSHYKNEFDLSDDFFNKCRSKGTLSNKGYLVSNDKISETFNSEWGIYAYGDLRKLTYKGGEYDV